MFRAPELLAAPVIFARRSLHRDRRLFITVLATLLLAGSGAGAGAEEAETSDRLESTERAVQRFFDVTYATRDDLELKADVYVPEGEGPFPGVVMVHGGAWLVGNKRNMRSAAQLVASHGYTVASINYSLAPRHQFPAPVEDCKAAVRWMREEAGRYKVNPRKIAGYGYSAGGHLVSMLGVTDAEDGLEGEGAKERSISTRLQAVVVGGAPCDLEQIPEDAPFLAYFLGGSRREVPQVYRRASPTTYATADDPPFFFFHGEADSMVPLDSPKALKARLEAAGVPARFHVVDGKGHITTFLDREPVLRAVEFLDQHLKRGEG